MRAKKPSPISIPLGRRLIWSLLILCIVMGGLELAARWMDPRLPSWQGEDSLAVVMTGHPDRLWGLGEGERQNAGAISTISSLGIRAPVPQGPRQDDQERILILGDSTFFGYGVQDEETLAAALDRALGPDIHAINAGVPGYSTAQSERLMDEVGWSLQPTLLLIANFWSDTNFAPYADRDLLKTASEKGWLHRSALARLIAGRLRLGGIVSWTRFDLLPSSTHRRVPVDEYIQSIDRLIQAATQRGIGVALMTPPEAVEVTRSARPPHHWDPYLKAQAALAHHHQIPHIQTTAAFRSVYEARLPIDTADAARSTLFLDDLHPTALGQTLMAEVVVETLRAAQWPENRMLSKASTPLSSEAVTDDVTVGNNHRMDQSPMSNLFPHGAAASTTKAPRTKTSSTPPSKVADPPSRPQDSAVNWWVTGEVTIQDPSSPCRVKVSDLQGRILASATRTRSGPYRLRIANDIEEVSVGITGPGCTAQGRATKAQGGQVQLTSRQR